METSDNFDSSEDDSEKEKANVSLMASIRGSDEEIHPWAKSELDSDINEIFSNISRSDLTYYLFGNLEKQQKLQIKFKELKKVHEFVSE